VLQWHWATGRCSPVSRAGWVDPRHREPGRVRRSLEARIPSLPDHRRAAGDDQGQFTSRTLQRTHDELVSALDLTRGGASRQTRHRPVDLKDIAGRTGCVAHDESTGCSTSTPAAERAQRARSPQKPPGSRLAAPHP
jgi:hypothetical protein